MQSKVVRTLALALLLGGVGLTVAQQSGAPPGSHGKQPGPGSSGTRLQKQKAPPEKSKLEEMLAEALKNNPDIRVAAAKLAEADAELNRTRLLVTQKVVMLYHAIETQKKVVENAEKQDKRAANAGATIPSGQIDEIHQSLALAKAKLAELEAQIPALLGKSPQSDYEQSLQEAKLLRQESIRSRIETRRATIAEVELEKVFRATGPMAERLRKALQTPIKVDYKDVTFDAILKDLAKKVPGLSFRNIVGYERLKNEKMNLRFEDALPISAILQALADEIGCYFFVREYGIVATDGSNQPPGAMTVEQFLRQKPTPTENPAGSPANAGMPWKPPENIEGTIKGIAGLGFLEIDFNSIDGLLSGHTLYVYRPSEGDMKRKYLGTIRMVNVQSKGGPIGGLSVAQPMGSFTESPKVGDKVTSRAPEK